MTKYIDQIILVVSAPNAPAGSTPSPSQNGDLRSSSKIETFKNWGISTYKCTRQIMFEKLGKTSRTVDTGVLIFFFFFYLVLFFILMEIFRQKSLFVRKDLRYFM
jgi:hypothetical protein